MKLLKLILIAGAAAVIVGIGTLQIDKQLWKNQGKSDKPKIDFARELYGDPGPVTDAKARFGPDPLRDKVKSLLNDEETEHVANGSVVKEWWNWGKAKVFGKPKPNK